MSFSDVQILAGFGPLGTPELLVLLFLFVIFGGVTAAVIAGAIYLGKRGAREKPLPPPAPPVVEPPPPPPAAPRDEANG